MAHAAVLEEKPKSRRKPAATKRRTPFVKDDTKALKVTTTKESLNLRIDPGIRDLIDRAADISGQTRTDFMVISAKEKATEILLNQTYFRLKPADWSAFCHALDNPPLANDELKRLLTEKAPWEQ